MNNKTDIIHRKHSLCGQMNDVLCYFGKRQSTVKLQLMKIYCTSVYGSVLWDLGHPAISAFMLHGERVYGGFGVFHTLHIAAYYIL